MKKKRKSIETSVDLVHALAYLFGEIELETSEIDAVLREAGYEPDEVGAQMKVAAKQALAKKATRNQAAALNAKEVK